MYFLFCDKIDLTRMKCLKRDQTLLGVFSKKYYQRVKERKKRKKENKVTRKKKYIRGATRRTKYACGGEEEKGRQRYELVHVHHKSYCPPLTEFVEVFSLSLTLAPLSTEHTRAPRYRCKTLPVNFIAPRTSSYTCTCKTT